MADNMIARIENQVLNIFHRAFIITSNDKSVVSVIVPVLITLMAAKYHGTGESPFVAHSKTMTVAVFSILTYYYMEYGAKLRFGLLGNPPNYAFQFMVFFGNMGVASLASIFFFDFIRPVLYLLCVLISAGEWLYWVYNRDEQIFRRNIYGFFINLWKWNKWPLAYFFKKNADHDQQFPGETV